MELIPAIDLLGGKVVRLKEGDPARMTSYSEDPAETQVKARDDQETDPWCPCGYAEKVKRKQSNDGANPW